MPYKNREQQLQYLKNHHMKNKAHHKDLMAENYQQNKEKYHGMNTSRIVFLGKQIQLLENPRKGICSECGKTVESGEIKYTNIHHENYYPEEPLKDTRELCVRCHNNKRIGKS